MNEPSDNISLSPLRAGSWLGFSSWFLLFIFLPLALAWNLVGGYLVQEKLVRDERISNSSKKFLNRIAGWTEISFQLQNRFQFLRDGLFQRRVRPNDLPGITRNLKKFWGTDVGIYLFDDSGSIIKTPGLDLQIPDKMEEFWAYLPCGYKMFLKSTPEFFQKIFGEDLRALCFRRGLLTRFFGMDREGFLFWDFDPLSTKGGILFVVRSIPAPMQVVKARLLKASLSSAITIFAKTADDLFIPLHGLPREPGPEKSGAGISARNLMELVSQLSEGSGHAMFRFRERSWVALPVKDFTFFLGVSETASTLEFAEIMSRLTLFLFGLFGFISGYRWLIRGNDAYLSIRFKLIFLFLYTLMIPLMGILALSYKTYHETGQVLLDNCRKEGLETIKEIDDGFLNEPLRLQKECTKYLKRLSTSYAQKNFARIMDRYLWHETFQTAELRDETGETYQNIGSSSGREEAVRKVLRQFFLNAIKKYLPDRILANPEKHREGVTDLYIQSIVESADVGFTALLENPGTIRHLLLPKRDMFFFWNFYTDPGLPAPIFFGTVFRSDVKDWYLKKAFVSMDNRAAGENQVFTFDRTGTFWLPNYGSLSPTLQNFAQQIRITGDNQFGKFHWRGKPWIAVGSPGKQIPEYSFITLIPESRITEPLHRLQKNISLAIGVVLFLTIFFAWSLAGMFLNPIRELEKGISAIKSRDSNFRLREFQKDEFGDLSKAFNEMVESMEELNAGKLVQEALFPRDQLNHGDYGVFGISQPATDLGGDYFDYISIYEKRFLVLIGDVSGHGIPAALIMAMSKAIVATFPKGNFDLERLLTKLNLAFQSAKKSRRLMTAVFMLVDSHSHQITVYHCGHPNPLHWKARGSADYISGKGLPLGFSAKINFNPTKFYLAPGERLVLYTDGLIESFSEDPEADSFELFRAYIAEQPWLSLRDNCHSVINYHPFFNRSKAQPDDFTVVILERKITT